MFTIIIPIKNQYAIVEKCISSVLRHYQNEEVIIIDDGSSENSLLELLEKTQIATRNKWKFFRNNLSVGHTKACEIGIQNSVSENIFLLNSDTIVTKNSLNILSNVLDRNKDIAVVGPSTSSASGEQLIKELYNNRFGKSVDDIESFAFVLEQNKEIVDIDLVNGFCFAMKRKVFNDVGGFDPNLTCYGNEKELLIRIRKAGYRTVWVKGSYVHHFGKMSYSHEDLNIGKAQKDADVYILQKHKSLK